MSRQALAMRLSSAALGPAIDLWSGPFSSEPHDEDHKREVCQEPLESVVCGQIKQWQHKHGSIERLTIAAFVDTEALNKSDPPITLEQVEKTIKKAVGFKADRDEIQVTGVKMPVATPDNIEDDSASQARLATILTIVRNVSIGAREPGRDSFRRR